VARSPPAADIGISPDSRDTSAKEHLTMVIVIYTVLLLSCSAVMSAVAFLVGRCGRRLPVDDMLPRVVRRARFDAEDGWSPSAASAAAPAPAPRWPHMS
jgi:cytosine/uracil/thiamine/allantoin permease